MSGTTPSGTTPSPPEVGLVEMPYLSEKPPAATEFEYQDSDRVTFLNHLLSYYPDDQSSSGLWCAFSCLAPISCKDEVYNGQEQFFSNRYLRPA